MKYYLAFDVGTTAMKAILYDENFNEVFVSNDEYTLLTPRECYVELDSEEYIRGFGRSVKKISEKGFCMDDIVSVTFTTQGETLIPIDKNGDALTNAVVWLDMRAQSEAEHIKNAISEDEFYRHTGLCTIDGALPAAKLLWIYNNRRDIYDKTYKFLLLEDFLIYRLTGKTVSNMSLLSSTGWFDIFSGAYYDDILDACCIDREKLTDILKCGEIVGNVTEEAAKQFGLSEKTIVTTGAMDQISSALGAGNIKEGVVTETTGTALVVGACCKNPNMSAADKITVYHHFDDSYIYMPFCRAAGIVLKWFKDNMMSELSAKAAEKGVSTYSLIDRLAEKANAGSGGVICFPYFAGCDDIENSNGAFFGLTLKTSKAELSRSVLEGIAFMLRDCIEALRRCGVNVSEIHSLGGGAYSDIWTQIKASVCDLPVNRHGSGQSTALGAAILGASAVSGVPAGEITKSISGASLVYPKKYDAAVYKKAYKNYRALYELAKNYYGKE